uniref:Uncharacterized protein n=1 Tax=Panagrolaimus sp. PS1159 TaxID=55785 RepID=A0AC35F9I5_9BILA
MKAFKWPIIIFIGTTAFAAYFILKLFEKEVLNDKNVTENEKVEDEEEQKDDEMENSDTNESTASAAPDELEEITPICLTENYETFSLEQLICHVQSVNHVEQLAALKQICKLLTSDKEISVEALIENGVFPVLVECLKSNHAKVQHKAAWALKTIAGGNLEQTQAVIDAGGVPALVELLHSPHLDVCEQVVYALGNIICAGSKFRDYCIEEGCIEPMLNLIKSETIDVHLLFSIALILPNLFQNPALPCEVVYALLPALAEQILTHDPIILTDTAKLVSFLTAGKEQDFQEINYNHVIKSLVLLFNHPDTQVQYSSLYCLSTFLSKIPSETQISIDENIILQLIKFLNSANLNLCKQALKVIEKLANRPQQNEQLLNSNLILLLESFNAHHDNEVESMALSILSKLKPNNNNDV